LILVLRLEFLASNWGVFVWPFFFLGILNSRSLILLIFSTVEAISCLFSS
jgi:hypothetical protein